MRWALPLGRLRRLQLRVVLASVLLHRNEYESKLIEKDGEIRAQLTRHTEPTCWQAAVPVKLAARC